MWFSSWSSSESLPPPRPAAKRTGGAGQGRSAVRIGRRVPLFAVEPGRFLDEALERRLVQVGQAGNLNVAHAVAIALKQALWVGELRAAPKPKIDIAFVSLDPRERPILLVDRLGPFPRLAGLGRRLAHDLPDGADRLGLPSIQAGHVLVNRFRCHKLTPGVHLGE